MARLKPSGIRLRVWRALRDSERQEALDLNADPDRQLSTLRRLTQQAAHRPLPSSPVPGAMRFVEHQLPPPKLARSKRHALVGELEGWLREDRTTASGRRYSIWIPPFGPVVMSKAAALRVVQDQQYW